jgi:hypothetical protein
MMHIRRSVELRFVLAVFAMGGFLAAAPMGFAASNGDPDEPSIQAAREPRSIVEEIQLANDYLAGHGVAQDLKQSAFWFKKAAESGDPHAEMQIGYFYDAGIGVEKDAQRAAHWYQLAAAGGLPGAKVNLGVLYLWGTGVEKNESLAIEFFREAAAKGSGLADCYLGNVYYLGVGVPEDKAQGEQWYKKGAASHNPQAEYDLGTLLFTEKDHAHDPGKAANLFRAAAAAGYVPAMASLGLLLVRNPALAQSPGEAVDFLNKSAEAGSWKSSMILGVVSRDGKGVLADPSAAYYHFQVAALQGGEEARRMAANDSNVLAARLGPAQTAALDSRAGDWYRQHHVVLEFVYKGSRAWTLFPNYALAGPESGTHVTQIVSRLDDLEKPISEMR